MHDDWWHDCNTHCKTASKRANQPRRILVCCVIKQQPSKAESSNCDLRSLARLPSTHLTTTTTHMRSSLLAAGHVHNCCAAASLRSPHVTHAHQHARLAQSRRPHHQHHTTNTMSAAASGDSQPTTTTTHMLASFSSEEDRAAFTAKFKLVSC